MCVCKVQEDESAVPKKDAYMQIAIFNEQMKPVFDLLKAVEHVKLSKTLLEPTPSAASDNKRYKWQYAGLRALDMIGNCQRPVF